MYTWVVPPTDTLTENGVACIRNQATIQEILISTVNIKQYISELSRNMYASLHYFKCFKHFTHFNILFLPHPIEYCPLRPTYEYISQMVYSFHILRIFITPSTPRLLHPTNTQYIQEAAPYVTSPIVCFPALLCLSGRGFDNR
jgi:hypothetical protein